MLNSPVTKYPGALRILHWLMALLIIGMLVAGLIMVRLPHDDPNRSFIYGLHKSFGVTILALAALRIIFRLSLGTPPLPSTISWHERLLAHMGHLALYGFMIAMPVSGYIMSTSFGLPVKWFGFMLPRWVGIDKTRGEWSADFHAYAAYALIGLLLLHIGAVILHYCTHRINLLKRML